MFLSEIEWSWIDIIIFKNYENALTIISNAPEYKDKFYFIE